MPSSVLPWKSDVHRRAATALFRRLLSLSRSAVSGPEARSAFRNLVHHKFRQHRRVTSRHTLGAAFREAYEVVDLLSRSGNGDPTAASQVDDLISRIPDPLRQPPRSIVRLKTPDAKPTRPPRDPSDSILARPRLDIPGKRHVPVLVDARGIPFLRIKKPQPRSLSAYLQDRYRRSHRRTMALQAIEGEWLPMSVLEDSWDRIVAEEAGIEKLPGPGADTGSGWTEDLLHSRSVLYDMIGDDFREKQDMLFKMLAIIQAERKLAEEEAAARSEQKHAAKSTTDTGQY